MEFYRLLLLDDEEVVLESIKKVFDFKEYGFLLEGAFSRPLRALENLEQIRPDLIITDIRMPLMSGIEFSEKAKEVLPDVEIVILSGYDDFAYAQTAVKLGISDYLLKPVKKDDFVRMIMHMHEKIRKKKKDAETVEQLRRQAELNNNELKTAFFLQLTEHDNTNWKRLEQVYKHLELDFDDRSFILVKFYFDNIEFEEDMMSEVGKLSVGLESLLSAYGSIESYFSDECAYIFLYYEGEGAYAEITEQIREYNSRMQSTHLSFRAGCSREHLGMRQLFAANNECNQNIWANEASASDSIDNLNEVLSKDLTIPYDRMENLFLAVMAADREGIEEAAAQIYRFPDGINSRLALQYSYSISFLILLRLYQIKLKYEISENVIPVELLELRNLRYQYPTISEQEAMVEEFSEMLSELIRETSAQVPSQIVKAAKDYIKLHYSENISLAAAAKEIGLSRNYLCDIFKKETGTTFLNYLTDVRIEKAKELLKKPDMKMYEIGEIVGFHDYTYFSQIFKKRTGMTLSAYRKQI